MEYSTSFYVPCIDRSLISIIFAIGNVNQVIGCQINGITGFGHQIQENVVVYFREFNFALNHSFFNKIPSG